MSVLVVVSSSTCGNTHVCLLLATNERSEFKKLSNNDFLFHFYEIILQVEHEIKRDICRANIYRADTG